MEVIKKTILQALITGTTIVSGVTKYVIIPNPDAVYHMKIGLDSNSEDIGFFDVITDYVSGSTTTTTSTTTSTSTTTTTSTTTSTSTTTTNSPSCNLNMTLNIGDENLNWGGYLGNYNSNYGNIIVNYGDGSPLETIEAYDDGGTWFYYIEKTYGSTGIYNVSIQLPICDLPFISFVNANISQLNIIDFPNIEHFELVNQLVELNIPDLNNFKSLKHFYLNGGVYETTDFTVLPLLEELSIGSSDITGLNINNMGSLLMLSITQCTGIATIDVAGLYNLLDIDIVDTPISINNLNELTSITILRLENVNMSNIDLSVIPSLEIFIVVNGTSFTDVFDFSQSPNLYQIAISSTSLTAGEIETSIYSVYDRTSLTQGSVSFAEFPYTPTILSYLASVNWTI
jgi:hypothetical protein